MGYLSLKNWERFQHYKDRDPPWVKLYRDLLSSEAWVLGTDQTRLVQIASILIAARYSNQIPLKWGLIIKVCNLDMSEKQLLEAVEALRGFDFLEIHNDQEDTTTASNDANKLLQPASKPLATCPSEAEQSRAETETEQINPAPEGLDLVSWNRWIEYRKQLGKPVKRVSMLAAQQKLAAHGSSQAAVVEQSIANGWQGLFEPPGKRVDPAEERRKRALEASWARVRNHAREIQCPLNPTPVDNPDSFETRVKDWERRSLADVPQRDMSNILQLAGAKRL